MKKKQFIIAMVMMPLLFSCSQNETQNENPVANSGIRVKVEKLNLSNPENKLKYSGSIEATTSTPLSFQTTGTVQHIYVNEGDAVKKGQLIAETDKTAFQSAYNAAFAQYEQAIDAQARLKKVYDKGSLPEVKWVEINSQVTQAEAQLKISSENLDNCELRAPVDGIIGRRDLEVGMSAIQMQAPFSIINIDDVYIKIPVTENEISIIETGQIADVHVAAVGSDHFEGKIERIGIVANQLSRTYDVKIRVNNEKHLMKPGMVCNVEIKLPVKDAYLLLPMEAVSGQTEGSPYVYLIDPKLKIAIKRPVKLGGIVNNKLHVLSGLSENDLVVTYGKHKLSDKARVIY